MEKESKEGKKNPNFKKFIVIFIAPLCSTGCERTRRLSELCTLWNKSTLHSKRLVFCLYYISFSKSPNEIFKKRNPMNHKRVEPSLLHGSISLQTSIDEVQRLCRLHSFDLSLERVDTVTLLRQHCSVLVNRFGNVGDTSFHLGTGLLVRRLAKLHCEEGSFLLELVDHLEDWRFLFNVCSFELF